MSVDADATSTTVGPLVFAARGVTKVYEVGEVIVHALELRHARTGLNHAGFQVQDPVTLNVAR